MTSSFTFMSENLNAVPMVAQIIFLMPLLYLPISLGMPPTHLPADKLTYIQEALCWWANRKYATLYACKIIAPGCPFLQCIIHLRVSSFLTVKSA